MSWLLWFQMSFGRISPRGQEVWHKKGGSLQAVQRFSLENKLWSHNFLLKRCAIQLWTFPILFLQCSKHKLPEKSGFKEIRTSTFTFTQVPLYSNGKFNNEHKKQICTDRRKRETVARSSFFTHHSGLQSSILPLHKAYSMKMNL